MKNLVQMIVNLWHRTWLMKFALLLTGFGMVLSAIGLSSVPYVSGSANEEYRMIPVYLLLYSQITFIASVVLLQIARAIGHAK